MSSMAVLSGIQGGALGVKALEFRKVSFEGAIGIKVEQRAARARRGTYAFLLGEREKPRVAVALLGNPHLK